MAIRQGILTEHFRWGDSQGKSRENYSKDALLYAGFEAIKDSRVASTLAPTSTTTTPVF